MGSEFKVKACSNIRMKDVPFKGGVGVGGLITHDQSRSTFFLALISPHSVRLFSECILFFLT